MKQLVLSLILLFEVFLSKGQTDFLISAGDTSFQEGMDLLVDDAGNIYVTGYFEGTLSFGSNQVFSSGGFDIFIAKFNSVGNNIWIKKAGGAGLDIPTAITKDENNNVYITGYYSGQAVFSQNIINSNAGSQDVFIAKYDENGNNIWAKTGGGSFYEYCYDIAFDYNNSLYITGYFGISSDFNGNVLSCEGSNDVFIVKYNLDGNVVWAVSNGGLGQDEGYTVSCDKNGNVFSGGIVEGVAYFESDSVVSSGSLDAFICKLDSNGNLLWVYSEGGSGTDLCRNIIVDTTGYVYTTGYFEGVGVFGDSSVFSINSTDLFIAKYENTGTVLWVRSLGSESYDSGYDLAINYDQNQVFVTGHSREAIIVFGDTMDHNGGTDVFVARFEKNGSFLGISVAGSTGYDNGRAIEIDNSSFICTGAFEQTAFFNSTPIVSNGSSDVFIWKDQISIMKVEELNKDWVLIYPNPTTDYFIVNEEKIDLIQVIDQTGRLHVRTENQPVNVSSLSKGVYFVLIEKDGQTYVSKLIIR